MVIVFGTRIKPEMVACFSFCSTAQQSGSDKRGVLQKAPHRPGGIIMECFTHAGRPAVGVCHVCGKAVCHSCVVDTGVAITCSDVCAKEAVDLREMSKRTKKIYGIGVAKQKIPSGTIMWLLFAVFFGCFGIYRNVINREPEWFSFGFAGLAVVMAIFAYRRAKEMGLQC
jgi:hypothetical protein